MYTWEVVLFLFLYLALFFYVIWSKSKRQLNPDMFDREGEVKPVVFKIVKAEMSATTKCEDGPPVHRMLCKYTAVNSFFRKPGLKDYECDFYVFYDVAGKYNIGDTLKLDSVSKECDNVKQN